MLHTYENTYTTIHQSNVKLCGRSPWSYTGRINNNSITEHLKAMQRIFTILFMFAATEYSRQFQNIS
jgi:hypothetical protein